MAKGADVTDNNSPVSPTASAGASNGDPLTNVTDTSDVTTGDGANPLGTLTQPRDVSASAATVNNDAALARVFELTELGAGGMCRVSVGRQKSTGFTCAVKQLLDNEFDEPKIAARLAEEPGRVNAILASGEISPEAKRHFPQFSFIIEGTDRLAVAAELQGPSFRELIKQGLSQDRALKLFLHACDAAQAYNVVVGPHGDLNDSAFCVSRNNPDDAVMTDFSTPWAPLKYTRPNEVVNSMDIDSDDAKKISGTAPFMAPEQWLRKADERTDVYQLCCLLQVMFAGRVPQELKSICLQGKEALPENRFESIAELKKAVMAAVTPSETATAQSTVAKTQLVEFVSDVFQRAQRGRPAGTKLDTLCGIDAVSVIDHLHLDSNLEHALAEIASLTEDATSRGLFNKYLSNSFFVTNLARTQVSDYPMGQICQLVGMALVLRLMTTQNPILAAEVVNADRPNPKLREDIAQFYLDCDELGYLGEDLNDIERRSATDRNLLRGALSIYFELSPQVSGVFEVIKNLRKPEIPATWKTLSDKTLTAVDCNFLLALEERRSQSHYEVDTKLQAIVEHVTDPENLAGVLATWIGEAKAISVADLNFLLDNLPYGVEWGENDGSWDELINELAPSKIAAGHSEFCAHDVSILWTALAKTTKSEGVQLIGEVSGKIISNLERLHLFKESANTSEFRSQVTNFIRNRLQNLQKRFLDQIT